ncbi:zinc finger and BTB domain-containing protein 14 [Eurytemora carolleeae]|uniref:zinc finger and BTB domain-containing protein 14 n=1 Tax=Eurytemora carolleeae TaxID=1294199 RepID=UPI000C75F729|nr:zinc finger and BTB domain-containing protein 14 [Eurytemora carolleeae]|eukprot:XP_023331274.1 zinc finger and BTB domain-containing protein 14-like [Eurytemora affinis]
MAGGSSSDFCLKWNDHHNVFFSTAEKLCGSNLLCDVTLSAGGLFFQAHKLVLSICSDYFQKVFSHVDKGTSTVIYLKGVDSRHLELILSYMYRGEITLQESELVLLLATASELQVKGLSEMHQDKKQPKPNLEQTKPDIIKPEPRKSVESERQQKRKNDLIIARSSLPEKVLKLEDGFCRKSVEQDLTENELVQGSNSSLLCQETQLISKDDITDLTADDVEEFEYDEEISEIGGEFTETEQYFDYENQTSNPSAVKHKKPIVLKAFQCGMCEMSFDQKWLLKRHYRTHTRERPFRCTLCSRNFSLRDSCIRHIRNVHRAELDSGEVNVSDVGSYCQYDEGSGLVDSELMYENEALALTM